jgi:hypothetical protein
LQYDYRYGGIMKKKNKRRKQIQQSNSTKLPVVLIVCIVLFLISAVLLCWVIIANQDEDAEGIKGLAEQYLEDKYNMDFTYAHDETPGQMMFYNEDLPSLVSVFRKDTLEEQSELSVNDFTEKFADNAYPIIHNKEIEKYIAKLITTDIGNYRAIPMFNAQVQPSAITDETDVHTFMTEYSEYTGMTLFVLTDTYPDNDTLAKVENELSVIPSSIMLRIVHEEADMQEEATAPVLWLELPYEVDGKTLLYASNIHDE